MASEPHNSVQVGSGNVFADLGFSPEKALSLQFKAKILSEVLGEIRRKKYTQGKLVALLDEHQPVVSNLLRGKISHMSIERLLIYAHRLGIALNVSRLRTRRRSAA